MQGRQETEAPSVVGGDAPSRGDPGISITISCLAAGGEPELVDYCKGAFAQLGINLVVNTFETVEDALVVASHEALTFVLASAGATCSILRSVQFPPLVVIADKKLTPAERERFRLQGAACILERPLSVDHDGSLLRKVATSARWSSSTIDCVNVSDLLQMVAAKEHSVMVTVSCSHGKELSGSSWEEIGVPRCQSGEGTACHGWMGRVYVHRGTLIHAETPTANGLHALAQMMELRKGTVRIHEVFLAPEVGNITGSMDSNILTAALLVDDWHSGLGHPIYGNARSAPASTTARTDPLATKIDRTVLPSAPATAAGSTPLASSLAAMRKSSVTKGASKMHSLDHVLSQLPGAKGAARGDDGGNVVELTGQLDAESVCAVATMCKGPLEKASELLGLGGLCAWSASNAQLSLYVHKEWSGFIAAVGGSTKSPDGTLKKLEEALEQDR